MSELSLIQPWRRARLAAGLDGRVWLLVAGMTAATVTLYLVEVRHLVAPQGDARLPWWGLAIVFLLADGYPIRLRFRTATYSLSLSEVGLVLGLFLVAPGALLVAQLCGAGIALVVVRRLRPVKAAFNLTGFALASSVALLIFHAAIGLTGNGSGPPGWAAGVAAAAAFALTSVFLVTLAIALTDGFASARELRRVSVFALAASLASASGALAAVELFEADPSALVLLLVPAAICTLALRAYAAERRRHEHVDFLYRSMRTMQDAPELRTAQRELLDAARTMLCAEFAEIVLFEAGAAGQVLRTSIGPDGELVEATTLAPEYGAAIAAVSSHESAVLLPRGRPPHELDGFLARHDLSDAIVTSLRSEDRVSGLLLVGNRAGDIPTFNADDRRLFETFTSHAAVLLENNRVKEQLRYQAYHDDLTGLPNRVLFTQRVGQALDRDSGDGLAPTVLFVDLDDFKTINDSFGHTAGDDLLIEVANRVRAAVRESDTAARLGGDEFGVLLENMREGEPERVAGRIVEALRAPFGLQGREVLIHASIGIASSHSETHTADELLANADVAMYTAKSSGKRRYALYEPRMHTRVRRRYELATALEQAVERNEIGVHYQPIVCLNTGRTVAVEALARWFHPQRGLILPGAFVPLAEEIGLIAPIGRKVLHEACRQTREWQTTLPGQQGLSVCVNLSPSEIQNPLVTKEVLETLTNTGLPPESLILEIIERGAMHDHDATVSVLQDLRSLGVRLALDDFGTGHSSLSHLRDFPIDILKIAKPFVDRIGGKASETTMIDAILHLGDALELEVVAEGIETLEQAETLRRLECPLGQGYHFSRPVARSAIEARLAAPAEGNRHAHIRAA